MGVTWGWVVVALAGVAAGPQPDRKSAEITYTVQHVQTEGLGWREAMLTQLTPVARQGAATIWTAPQAAAKQLIAQVSASKSGKVLAVPKVTAYSGAPCHITSRSNHELVTQVAWNADGDDRTAAPVAEKLRTGWMTTMVGRALDQGVLVQLVIEDTAITAVHHVRVSDARVSQCGKSQSGWVPKPAACAGTCASHAAANPTSASGATAFPNRSFADIVMSIDKAAIGRTNIGACAIGDIEAACSEEKCNKAQGCCETAEDEPLEDDADVQQLTIAVPEIRAQEVAGEWLIPKGQVLLVSFGVYTAADQNGKAVVKERLAMVSAAPAPSDCSAERSPRIAAVPVPIVPHPAPVAAAVPTPSIVPPVPFIAPPPVVVPAAPFSPFTVEAGQHAPERAPLLVPALPAPANPVLPHPTIPSRTMPQGFHKDGTISNLPPLPDELEPPASESSEPMPSPQTKKSQEGKPATDPKAAKAAYSPRPVVPFSIPSLFLPSTTSTPAGLQFLLPIKPFSIKLPFKQRLEIEIFGRLVPDTESSSKSVEQTQE
jgi:hypothetical protein